MENGYPDDRVGNGYPVHHTKNVWEKRFSRIVIPSEVEGSLLQTSFSPALLNRLHETPYPTCMEYQASRFRSHAHRAFHRERKRFLAALEMTAWGMGIPMTAWEWISRASHKECERKHFSRIVIPSEVEGSFSLAVRRRTLTAKNGKHRIAEGRCFF